MVNLAQVQQNALYRAISQKNVYTYPGEAKSNFNKLQPVGSEMLRAVCIRYNMMSAFHLQICGSEPTSSVRVLESELE